MASYLQIENISKSYGPKVLFEHIGFNINEGDKIALIAPNGTGKTSLMRILAGKDKSDSGGKIMFLKDISIAFLEQEYDYDPQSGIFDQIMSHSHAFTANMDQDHLWEYERRVKEFLTNFKLGDFNRRMKDLSGGEIKRVAITEMLSTEADFFIMDEPTNHLDIEAIEYLESYLSRSRCTLLMVTHDRYFLDKVCNTIMEMDRGAIYTYKGNYLNYLEKREERIANFNAETDKARNIFRRELEWIRSTPCARSGKARYRVNAFQDIKERASDSYIQKQVSLEGLQSTSRLGTKIIDCKNVSFSYGDRCYIKDFSYNFQRGEKVGIVGGNGSGKSTFINLLTGSYTPDMVRTADETTGFSGSNPVDRMAGATINEKHTGTGINEKQAGATINEKQAGGHPSAGLLTGKIERGESIRIGYYRQEGMQFNENDTVLETINDTGLLGRFLFPHDMLNNRISKLSGGEKRRLYLLTILKQNPNVLVLDEPTNDLDIVTLNVLEEYLKEFQGTLIIVSHDRHFLDRLVDHLFIFCPDGTIKDFVGSYSEYREYLKDYESQLKKSSSPARNTGATSAAGANPSKQKNSSNVKKLTWKEEREMEQLEKDLGSLAEEKDRLEKEMSSGQMEFAALQAASQRVSEIIALQEEKEMRWLELSCR